jgi:hypothetical protein
MAILKNGIFGGISGKVGNIIGSSWKGIKYVRSLPVKRTKKSTPAQLEQQVKFALMMNFLRNFSTLLALTFKNYSERMSGINAALSYNLRCGITGAYPNFALNYPLIRVSQGKLPTADNACAKAGEAGRVDFSWINNAGFMSASQSDFAILVIYNPITKMASYTLQVATREAGTASLYIPENRGYAVETWLAFMSFDTRNLSNSIYTGTVITT